MLEKLETFNLDIILLDYQTARREDTNWKNSILHTDYFAYFHTFCVLSHLRQLFMQFEMLAEIDSVNWPAEYVFCINPCPVYPIPNPTVQFSEHS